MTQSYKPRLRTLDFQPVVYQEQQMWLLRDPLELSEHQLILSPALAQMLIFCDGTLGIEEMQTAFLRQPSPKEGLGNTAYPGHAFQKGWMNQGLA